MNIQLRKIEPDDIKPFFTHQLDKEAQQLAAFTSADPTDWSAFERWWGRIFANGTVIGRTIEVNGRNAGSILRHESFGEPEISYWLDKSVWGQGVATEAVRQFLELVTERPLHARVAQHNIPSRRVLEKNGFVVTGQARGFANALQKEIDELLLTLN